MTLCEYAVARVLKQLNDAAATRELDRIEERQREVLNPKVKQYAAKERESRK